MGAYGYGLLDNDGSSDFIGSFLEQACKQISKQVRSAKRDRNTEDHGFFGAMYTLLTLAKSFGHGHILNELPEQTIDSAIELAKFYSIDESYLGGWKDAKEMQKTCKKLVRDLKNLKDKLEY